MQVAVEVQVVTEGKGDHDDQQLDAVCLARPPLQDLCTQDGQIVEEVPVVTAAPHDAVRTLVEHRYRAVPEQEVVSRLCRPLRPTSADRAAPVPGDQPSRNPICDERHAHETGGRNDVHADGVPRYPGRSHLRPLPAQHSVFRAARAAREGPDSRGGLRPSGAGTAGETAAGRMGRLPAKELRHRSAPGPRRPANALGSSGAAGPTPVGVSREQIAPPIVVSHYRIRRAGTRDRSAVVSRSADGRTGGAAGFIPRRRQRGHLCADKFHMGPLREAGEPFLVGNHRWVVCGSPGLGAPARHSEGEPASGVRRGRPRPRSGRAGASAVAAPRWRRPCQACRPEVSRNEILIFLEIKGCDSSLVWPLKLATRPSRRRSSWRVVRSTSWQAAVEVGRGLVERFAAVEAGPAVSGRAIGVLLCAPPKAGFARDLLRR